MAKIIPFRGILYNEDKIKNLEAVMAPPYDVISPSMREELYKMHNNNIVRIILGKDSPKDNNSNNKYTRAAYFLNKWLKEGVLKKDSSPSIYMYEQKYLYKGKLKRRIGFISLMRIEDPASSLVLPHEYTFLKPKEDRLNLIRNTKANTSPIFCIFQDDSRVIDAIRAHVRGKKPVIDIHFEGVGHRFWSLKNSKVINKIKRGLEKKQVFIADGHHRYEVALAFRNEMRKRLGRHRARKFDNVMVYLSSLTDENLTILSTYRVIKNLGGLKWSRLEEKLGAYFDIERVKDKKKLFEEMEKTKTGYTFGLYFKNRNFYILGLRDESVLDDIIKVDKSREWKRLNLTALHFVIFNHILRIDKISSNDENIIYTRDEDYAINLVKKGECEAAFFQVPTKVVEVQNVARDGERMPHKSTYFYPKLLTGLVINKF